MIPTSLNEASLELQLMSDLSGTLNVRGRKTSIQGDCEYR